MSNTGIALGAALVAGGFLSATGVLQQRAASRRPSHEALSLRLLWSLAHDRMWLMGLGTGVLSYAFQSLALAFGALALVQPVFLSELLFAVPISVRINKMSLGAREWMGLLSVAGGLAVGVVSAWPQRGNPLPSVMSWIEAIVLITAAAGGAVLAGRRAQGPLRSSLFAFAAAAVMALQSSLLAATVALMKQSPAAMFGSWQPYMLVPVTAVGVTLVMSAYQAGPLAASMPVIDSCEPSVAIAIGITLFSEHIRTGPSNLAGTAVGLLLFFVGVVLLDTSPVVHALQRLQERAEEDAATA